MDCGIPFCHQGCPLGNIIPDWNDLVYREHWQDAIDRLHATNNFPEFTGRLCPAPCEGSCVLGINDDPVTIKAVEVTIIDRAFDEGWVVPAAAVDPHRQEGRGRGLRPGRAGGRRAAQPRRPPGDGLRARGPHRRAAPLRHPRVQDGEARPRPPPGPHGEGGRRLPAQRRHRPRASGAPICGASSTPSSWPAAPARPRDLPVPGRELSGIHFAMEYLTLSNRRCEGDRIDDARFISAEGKRVVIIGGGDTGADCLGTVHRQRAASVHQFELLPRPARHPRGRQPVAAVAEHLPRLRRPRGGRRARLRGLDPALHRDRAAAWRSCTG